MVVLAVVAVIGLTACQSNTESEGEKGATPTSVVAQEATKEDANNEAATKTATTVSAEETKAESTAEPVVEPEELTWENSGLRVEIIEYDRFEYGNTMRIAIVTNTSENTYVIDNSQIMILPGETTYLQLDNCKTCCIRTTMGNFKLITLQKQPTEQSVGLCT